jgi:antitoxin CptB
MGVAEGTGRLRWRCRRGMKELDLLLTRYLDDSWPAASPAERAAFEAFLELPDPDIAGLLLGHAESPPEFSALVALLRRA